MTTSNHFSSELVSQNNSLKQPRMIRNPEFEAIRRICKADPLTGLRWTARSYSTGDISIRQAAHMNGCNGQAVCGDVRKLPTPVI